MKVFLGHLKDVYVNMVPEDPSDNRIIVKCYRGQQITEHESVYKNSKNYWVVIDTDSGMSICGGKTRKAAITNLEETLVKLDMQRLRNTKWYKQSCEKFAEEMKKRNLKLREE